MSQANPYGICGGESGIWTGLSSSTSVSPIIIQPMFLNYSFIDCRCYISLVIDGVDNSTLYSKGIAFD